MRINDKHFTFLSKLVDIHAINMVTYVLYRDMHGKPHERNKRGTTCHALEKSGFRLDIRVLKIIFRAAVRNHTLDLSRSNSDAYKPLCVFRYRNNNIIPITYAIETDAIMHANTADACAHRRYRLLKCNNTVHTPRHWMNH